MGGKKEEMVMSVNIWKELEKPFPVDRIHWRIGSTNKKARVRETGNQNAKPTKGLPLAYIDARDVMERLDDVLEGKWQDKYFETPKGRIICELSCYIDGEWITKSDGAGDTGEEGEKGAISDAFKRAAVKFRVGRYLYRIKNGWVDLDQYGKFKTPTLPDFANPNALVKIDKKVKDSVMEQSLSCLSEADENGLNEIWSEFDADEKVILWGMFNSQQRTAMKALMKTQ